MEEILNSYYENNAAKLHKMVNQIFYRKFGGITDRDMDEFYSVANDVFADIWKYKRYDSSKGDFEGFLYRALNLAFVDELKRQNRDKRKTKIDVLDENGNKVLDKNGKPKKISIPDVYMDAPINEGETLTIGDTLQSDFNMDTVLLEKNENYYSDKIEEFLDSLSLTQRQIAQLIMKGYDTQKIKSIMNITDKQYRDCWNVICSYDKKRALYEESNDMEEGKMNNLAVEENVEEKYKNTSYSIESISRQLKKKRIRDDHILQRHSGQWKNFEKSELISDILRGKSLTQIVICEEIKNGIKMQWLIDGKQRCTTLDDFLHDGFAISKNIKNYNIRFQAPKLDENGKEVLNADGFTDMEWKTFDIRSKKYSQLPEELQDIFRDRQIPVLYNMNCTKKDIAEDIARFNRNRPMNKAQNGWLGLDEGFAEFVENIAKMDFFQPEFLGTGYTKVNNTAGSIRRIIVEGIMVADFSDNFSKFEKMCEFLSEEASDSNFTEFYSLIERLTVICKTKATAALFNTKDSLLWFGLFSRFSKLGLNDKKFGEFMNEFETLRKMKIEGESFDDILASSKSTKDKSIVMKKVNHLEKLMNIYLNIHENKNQDNEIVDTLEFIRENVTPNITDEDVEQYKEVLDSLTLNVDNSSKLLDDINQVSLVAIVAYSFENDIDLDKWIVDFFERNKTYKQNQKENYLHMKSDIQKFINYDSKKNT